ncbi:hypothetical protein ATY31_10240 [Sinorhizobium americanum]|uniref:Uncharacterized protein n=1 Tax=Sinorhizobium americanum TaxID=194963 RepID=A0A2S3YQU0_9HYPH|nr:hypothetical protein ATY31_10240 [Sinorhizobium americanum]
MNPVDQWRAMERLVALGWTGDAIAVALALPVRQIRKLRLLADVLPAMLDQMARGDMPNVQQLRTIAAAAPEAGVTSTSEQQAAARQNGSGAAADTAPVGKAETRRERRSFPFEGVMIPPQPDGPSVLARSEPAAGYASRPLSRRGAAGPRRLSRSRLACSFEGSLPP